MVPISEYAFSPDFPLFMLWSVLLGLVLLSVVCLMLLHRLTKQAEALADARATRRGTEAQAQTSAANPAPAAEQPGHQFAQFDFRKLFEEAIDGIALADADTGMLLDCNQTLADMVERDKTELIGQPQTILHPPREIRARFSVTFEQHRSQAGSRILETQLITARGQIKDVEIKASRIECQGQQVLQGIFRDITARKVIEEDLARYQNQLENLNRSGAGTGESRQHRSAPNGGRITRDGPLPR